MAPVNCAVALVLNSVKVVNAEKGQRKRNINQNEVSTISFYVLVCGHEDLDIENVRMRVKWTWAFTNVMRLEICQLSNPHFIHDYKINVLPPVSVMRLVKLLPHVAVGRGCSPSCLVSLQLEGQILSS